MPHRKAVRRLQLCVMSILAGFSFSEAAGQDLVVIATTDFSVFGSLAAFEPEADTASVNLVNTHGDNAIRTYQGLVYVINQLGGDNIMVLDPEDLSVSIRQFSVGEGSNPRDIAFISETKAYVPRYAKASLLVVNPATGDSLKAIDLSPFADEDGIPEMNAALAVGGRVYVTCQRLDRNAFFAPTDRSVVAVIDAEADSLMDLDPEEAGVQGIDLTLKNPDTAVLRNGKIYISCVGAFLDFTDGGIEIVDTAENRSLGPGINEAELGGEVGAIAMSSDTRGYVVLGDSSFSNSIKPFDLSDRTASEPLDGHSGGFTPDIQIAGGKLYVADRGSFTDPESAGILIYDSETGERLKGPINTGLPPHGIAFVGPGSLASDFDADGDVDLDDFFAFAAVFGTKTGEAGFEDRFDLVPSGEIDFDDFFFFAGDFGKKG